MKDYYYAEHVEIQLDSTGKLWINVDGRCVVRVGWAEAVIVEEGTKTKFYRMKADIKQGDALKQAQKHLEEIEAQASNKIIDPDPEHRRQLLSEWAAINMKPRRTRN